MTSYIRILGIILTIIAIPFSILALFGLSDLPESDPMWIKLISIIWAFVNFTALPFILTGFAVRYRFDPSVPLAAILFIIITLIFFLILFSVIPGSLLLIIFLTLPPGLYLAGYFLAKRTLKPSTTSPF